MYVTLEEAKKFLRVEVDDDDVLISSLVTAAEETVEKFLGEPLECFATQQESGDLDRALPESIKIGILMYADDMYENREVMVVGTSVVENQMANRILHFHRRNLGV